MKDKREQVSEELRKLQFDGQLTSETIDNIEAIYKPKTKKIDLIQMASKEFRDCLKYDEFVRWFDYRKSLGKTLKVKDTVIRLAKKFNDTDIETIKDVVNHSIDNQYQGLFWDKFKNNGTTTTNTKPQRGISDEELERFINS